MSQPKGFVYFIATDDWKFVKIGHTTDPDKRFIQVRRMARRKFGSNIIVIGTFPGTCATEQWLQLQVSASRHDSDWFIFTHQVKDLIDRIPLLPAAHRPAHSLMRAMRNKVDKKYMVHILTSSVSLHTVSSHPTNPSSVSEATED